MIIAQMQDECTKAIGAFVLHIGTYDIIVMPLCSCYDKNITNASE